MISLLAVGIGGFFGAVSRYLISGFFVGYSFPLGTLLVNLIGSFLMGTLFALSRKVDIDEPLRLALTTGFLGALTTFSTFSLETLNLLQRGEITLGITSILLNVFGTIFAVFLGVTLTSKLL
jgi:CrcB protein